MAECEVCLVLFDMAVISLWLEVRCLLFCLANMADPSVAGIDMCLVLFG